MSIDPSRSVTFNNSIRRVTNTSNKARADLSAKLRLNGITSNNNRKDIQLINTGFLTSVPKRGRMIDTQKYIR